MQDDKKNVIWEIFLLFQGVFVNDRCKKERVTVTTHLKNLEMFQTTS